MCGGDAIVETIQQTGGLTWWTIMGLLLGKYLFTTICFASGAPGGTLFPLVAMGSLVGGLFGVIAINALGPSSGLCRELCGTGCGRLLLRRCEGPP